MSSFPDSITLGEAREWLRGQLDTGAPCPCCRQRAQIYRWSLYSTAARALILFHRLGAADRYVHVNELKAHDYRGQGDTSRLKYWGLLDEEAARRDDGGRAGYWMLTTRGHAFVHGTQQVPKYLYVYDGNVRRAEGPMISIMDALGKKFDYQELMSGG